MSEEEEKSVFGTSSQRKEIKSAKQLNHERREVGEIVVKMQVDFIMIDFSFLLICYFTEFDGSLPPFLPHSFLEDH